MPQRAVLVADDEDHIRQLVRLYLATDGFDVTEARTGKEALALWRETGPDLIILDIMLPETNGWEVLTEVRRERNTPVIMLTAKDAEVDKILGLELGADDYVTKPFSPRELVSRVKAVLRRADAAGGFVRRGYAAPHPAEAGSSAAARAAAAQGPTVQDAAGRPSIPGQVEVVSYPGLTVNRTSREVMVQDRILTLPPKEFDLLWVLASNPNRVFTREYLLETVWEYTYFGDIRTVDVHIRRLRQKVEKDPENPEYIKTAWGVGYKFEYHPGGQDARADGLGGRSR